MDCGAIILCGGSSARMGQDKASLPFGPGSTLLSRVAGIVASAIDGGPVVCVAGQQQVLPTLPQSVAVVRDPAAGCGPLTALAQGLHAIEAENAIAVGCDAPLITSPVLELLLGQLGPCNAAVATDKGVRQPLLAAYQADVATVADTLVAQGKRSLMALLDALAVTEVNEELLQSVDPKMQSLINCNTPEAYQQALALDGNDAASSGS